MFLTIFFVNVGKNIESNLKLNGYVEKSWVDLNNKCEILNSMFVLPVDRYEITKYIKQIKNHITFFENGLTNHILKQTADTISYPLAKIFNQSISSGTDPSCFKKCIVVPIYISGDPSNCM